MKTVYCFLYHDVTDDPKSSGFQNHDAYLYTHSVEHFSSNLDLILESLPENVIRMSSVPLDGLSEATPRLLMTFDDGGVSGMLIADELERRSLRGFFFMTTKMLGDPLFLSAKNLRQLDQRGHTIGTHSHNHFSPFNALSYTKKVNEWMKSCIILEDILGHPVTAGSIPGGAMDTDTFKSAENAGLKLLFTSEPSRQIHMHGSLTVIGRVCPKNSTSQHFIKWAVSTRTLLPLTLMWKAKGLIRILKSYNKPIKCKKEIHTCDE